MVLKKKAPTSHCGFLNSERFYLWVCLALFCQRQSSRARCDYRKWPTVYSSVACVEGQCVPQTTGIVQTSLWTNTNLNTLSLSGGHNNKTPLSPTVFVEPFVKSGSLRSQRATLWPKSWTSPTDWGHWENAEWTPNLVLLVPLQVRSDRHLRPPSHCLLLSRMTLQSSDQDCSRLCGGLVATCLLWQAVNRMCSHAGLGSTPDWLGECTKGVTQVTTTHMSQYGTVEVPLKTSRTNAALAVAAVKGMQMREREWRRRNYTHMALHKQSYAILLWTRHFHSSSPLISCCLFKCR